MRLMRHASSWHSTSVHPLTIALTCACPSVATAHKSLADPCNTLAFVTTLDAHAARTFITALRNARFELAGRLATLGCSSAIAARSAGVGLLSAESTFTAYSPTTHAAPASARDARGAAVATAAPPQAVTEKLSHPSPSCAASGDPLAALSPSSESTSLSSRRLSSSSPRQHRAAVSWHASTRLTTSTSCLPTSPDSGAPFTRARSHSSVTYLLKSSTRK
mmetsp:Transcript_9687/g.24473  ORF Transcript_9687/g.24473 Transcript_9687/m.24473 type:complete len:220 (-) Transcript_9687:627-1286(-)